MNERQKRFAIMDERHRNFANFELGDNVYNLSHGLIPELAEQLDVPLSNEPNSEELSKLVGAVGKNKVLRNNDELTAIPRETQIDFVERSGVQEELNRSLWTPNVDSSEAEFMVQTGAVANWMDRGERIAAFNASFRMRGDGTLPGVIIATGNRVMDTDSERANRGVQVLENQYDRYPTEYEYGRKVAFNLNYVRMGGKINTEVLEVHSQNGQQVAESLFTAYPKLLDTKIAFARVANAGVLLAAQMRQAARKQRPDYDADPANPQVYVLTDSFPIAQNEDQEAKPQEYQKAQTALRQVAVTAKVLHEAAGGE